MNPKKEYLLYILYKQSEEVGNIIPVSYKFFDSKYEISAKGISNSLFKRYLHDLAKEGYIQRVKKGYYSLTIKGKSYIMTKLISPSGGISPHGEITFQNLPQYSDYFYGIRLHNIKVEMSVKFKELPHYDIRTIKEVGFTAQFYTKNNEPYMLLHLDEINAPTPSEAIAKLLTLITQSVYILATKYKIYWTGKVWIKHWEWAYQFKLEPKVEKILDRIKEMFVRLGDKFNIHIDRSKGFFEIETTEETWAMFFFLMPYLQVLQYSQNLAIISELLKAKPEELYKKIDELRELLGLKDQMEKIETTIEKFAVNLETHLGVMNGIFGMLQTQTTLFNRLVLAIEKLNQKLDKL